MSRKTIYDIAQKAGVSIATVSRVMNNSDGITDKTREKVLKIADSLGYHPQAYAQGLARKKKNTIMVVVPVLSNYFFMEVLEGIQDEISNYHYDLNIFNLQVNGRDLFSQLEQILKRQWADGYLLISTHLQESQIKQLKQYESSLVFVDEDYPGIDSVSVNNEDGIRLAMEYFFKNNCRRIGLISGLRTSKPGRERIDGYKKALKKYGISINNKLITSGDSMYRDGFTEQNGYEAMKKLLGLSLPPDAVFCSSDVQALGALKAMKELGSKIPMIGYDDIRISEYVGLSTIRQPMYKMGTFATKRLIERMNNGDIEVYHKSFSPELILRASTDLKPLTEQEIL